MKPLNNLMLQREKTRILLMKSRIFLIDLEMEDDPSMNLTNNAVVLKLKRKNFKLLLKKLKQPLNKKKTRFSELNSNLDKSDKRLIAKFTRRKKSLKILAKITNAPWTLFKHPLKPNLEQNLKL